MWGDWRRITAREARAFEADVGRAPACKECAAIERNAKGATWPPLFGHRSLRGAGPEEAGEGPKVTDADRHAATTAAPERTAVHTDATEKR